MGRFPSKKRQAVGRDNRRRSLSIHGPNDMVKRPLVKLDRDNQAHTEWFKSLQEVDPETENIIRKLTTAFGGEGSSVMVSESMIQVQK